MKAIKANDLEELRYIATTYQKQGNLLLAEQVYTTLMDLESNAFGTESHGVAFCLHKLAELKYVQNMNREGDELILHAVSAWEKSFPSDYTSLLCYTDDLTKANAIIEQRRLNQGEVRNIHGNDRRVAA